MKAVSLQLYDLGAPKSPFWCLGEAVAARPGVLALRLGLGRAGRELEGEGAWGRGLCWWGGRQKTADMVCTQLPLTAVDSEMLGFPLSILGPPGK